MHDDQNQQAESEMHPTDEAPPLSANTKGLAMVAMIVGAAIFLLSGGCTLMFAADGNEVAAILGIGAFFYVPAALIFWAGWRLRKVGKNWLSTTLLIVVAAYVGLVMFGLFSSFFV